jgi:hypothetical protein
LTTASSTGQAGYVKNIRSGEPVDSPLLVKFGVVGFGVAPAGSPVNDAGYFVLNLTSSPA